MTVRELIALLEGPNISKDAEVVVSTRGRLVRAHGARRVNVDSGKPAWHRWDEAKQDYVGDERLANKIYQVFAIDFEDRRD